MLVVEAVIVWDADPKIPGTRFNETKSEDKEIDIFELAKTAWLPKIRLKRVADKLIIIFFVPLKGAISTLAWFYYSTSRIKWLFLHFLRFFVIKFCNNLYDII